MSKNVKFVKDGQCQMIFKHSQERCPNPIGETELQIRKQMCPICARNYCGAFRARRHKDESKHKCSRRPIPMGNGRCKFHGGKSLAGPAAKNLIHGSQSRYASYAPGGMVATLIESENDEELASLMDDIALVDARTKELLTRVTREESGKAWKDAKKAMKQHRRSLKLADSAATKSEAERHRVRATEALEDLEDAIARGEGDYAAWAEIERQMTAKRRLIDAETKRRAQLSTMMSQAQAMRMTQELFDIVTEHVTNPKALSAISIELGNLIGINTNTLANQGPDPEPVVIEGDFIEGPDLEELDELIEVDGHEAKA